jgi:LPPG:FO 2-phospho-L-lactate transferase
VLARGRWVPFQEFMIRERAEGPVDGFELQGIEAASAPTAVLEAIAGARAIVVGPSNPIVSVRPILAVPGIAGALRAASAPVVAVSPIVGGQVLKGPTHAFMAWADLPLTAAGVVQAYEGLLDGIVADEPVDGLPALQVDTRMDDAAARERVAQDVLRFAETL